MLLVTLETKMPTSPVGGKEKWSMSTRNRIRIPKYHISILIGATALVGLALAETQRSGKPAALVGVVSEQGLTIAQANELIRTTQNVATVSQETKLTASDAAAGDYFGISVAMSGETAIVGAIADNGAAGADQGSAYIFVRSGTTWSQEAKLIPSDAAASDRFGSSVAIDGNTVVIGALTDDGTAGADQGSAYVFVRSGTTWTEQAKLIPLDPAAGDQCSSGGVGVSGDTAIVGSYGDDGTAGVDQGSAYVYVRSGTTWTQQAKLTAGDSAALHYFGGTVTLDGDTAIVGSSGDGCTAGINCGATYVFVRSGTTWSEQAKLTPSDRAAGNNFGFPSFLKGDRALIGARGFAGPAGASQGAAYVFVRSGTTWSQQDKLVASDAGAGDEFGIGLALIGSLALVGAAYDDGTVAVDQGSAYVFVQCGNDWRQQEKIVASDADAGDFEFGSSIAFAGDTGLVGEAPENGPGLTDRGAAYVYRIAANDVDNDGVPDVCDNCVNVVNANQANLDGDVFGDACDQCPFDPTNTKTPEGQCIPTLSEWGMMAMAGLMLLAGGVVIARRRQAIDHRL